MLSDELIIIPKVIDTEAVYACLQQLEKLEESLFKTGEGGYQAVAAGTVNRGLCLAVTESMQKCEATTDPHLQEKVIQMMKNKLKNIPVLNLQTAISLPVKSVTTIYEWARMNLADPIVIDVTVDPAVLGGAKITFQGRYADKTIQAKWPQIWEEAEKGEKQPGGT